MDGRERSSALPRGARGDPGGAGASFSRLVAAGLLLEALALVLLEVALAQADRLGRDLDELVVVDELDRRLERELARRRQRELLVGGRRAGVCELLRLRRGDGRGVV